MDKKTFIGELEKGLSILKEEELRDIVGEYEQHIDMKVKSGLTEQEAIADFGSLEELTGEILEAYHVRADYASSEKRDKKSLFQGGGKVGKELLQQTGEVCTKTGKSTVKGLGLLWAWIVGVAIFWKKQIMKPFGWIKNKWEKVEKKPKAHIEEANTLAEKRFSVLGFLRNVFHGTIKLCFWCIRMVWNASWILFSGFCGIMGLFCLFAFGVCVVLLIQGYPLAGVTIGVLGLNLCLFGAGGFGLTLIIKKKREGEDCA